MSKQELDKLIAEEQAKNPTIEQVGSPLVCPDDPYDETGDEEQQADWEFMLESIMGSNHVCNLQFPKSPFNR